jgi:hypothetical protein
MKAGEGVFVGEREVTKDILKLVFDSKKIIIVVFYVVFNFV